MRFTLAIVGVILSYQWLVEPRLPPGTEWQHLATVLVLLLCIAHNLRSGEWGFSFRALLPATLWTIALTVPFVLLLVWIGRATTPERTLDTDFLVARLLYLLLWAGGQQFALQTVVLRESERATRRWAPLVAAAVFSLLHAPNPFLMLVTFVGGVIWCWIYSRQPNIIPLALSHAVSTMTVVFAFDPRVTGALRTGARYLNAQ